MISSNLWVDTVGYDDPRTGSICIPRYMTSLGLESPKALQTRKYKTSVGLEFFLGLTSSRSILVIVDPMDKQPVTNAIQRQYSTIHTVAPRILGQRRGGATPAEKLLKFYRLTLSNGP